MRQKHVPEYIYFANVFSQEFNCKYIFTINHDKQTHALSLRRNVPGRQKPFDDLLKEHRAAKMEMLKQEAGMKNAPQVFAGQSTSATTSHGVSSNVPAKINNQSLNKVREPLAQPHAIQHPISLQKISRPYHKPNHVNPHRSSFPGLHSPLFNVKDESSRHVSDSLRDMYERLSDDDDDDDDVVIIDASDGTDSSYLPFRPRPAADEYVDIESITDSDGDVDVDNLYNQLCSQAADSPESYRFHSNSCSVLSLQNKRNSKPQLDPDCIIHQDDIEQKEGNAGATAKPRAEVEIRDHNGQEPHRWVQEPHRWVKERQRRYIIDNNFRELSKLLFTQNELKMACSNQRLSNRKVLQKAKELIQILKRTYKQNMIDKEWYINENSKLKNKLCEMEGKLRNSGVPLAVIQGSLPKTSFECHSLHEVDSQEKKNKQKKNKQSELEMEGEPTVRFCEMEVPVKLVPVQSSNLTIFPLSKLQLNHITSSSLISNKSQTHVVSSTPTNLGLSARPLKLMSSHQVKQMALNKCSEHDPSDLFIEPDIYIDHAEEDYQEEVLAKLSCKEQVKDELRCEVQVKTELP